MSDSSEFKHVVYFVAEERERVALRRGNHDCQCFNSIMSVNDCGSWCPAFNFTKEMVDKGKIERTENGIVHIKEPVYTVTICTGQKYIVEFEE